MQTYANILFLTPVLCKPSVAYMCGNIFDTLRIIKPFHPTLSSNFSLLRMSCTLAKVLYHLQWNISLHDMQMLSQTTLVTSSHTKVVPKVFRTMALLCFL